MKQKRKKLGRKLLGFLLTLAMVIGLLSGMSLTAYAAQETKTVTWDYATWEAIRSGNTKDGIKFTGYKISGNLYDGDTTVFKAPAGYEFTQIEFPTTSTDIGNGEAANDGTFSVVDYTFNSTQDEEIVDGQKVTWTGKSDTVSFKADTYAIEYITFTMVGGGIGVESITINNSELTLTVGGTQTLTATVAPNDATDKTVKWSVGGTDTGAVKLYSNEACTTEVGADATEILTVYAKGESAGSATVTATSNADSEKKASCDVTVNAAQTQTEELLTTITATAKEQASYSTANVATVSFSYTAGGSSAYLANWGWWGYGWSATVAPANGYTITKCVFYDDANRTATDSSSPFVVETTEEDKTPRVNGNPILAYTSKGITKIEVYGYASKAAQTITASDVTATYGDTDKSVSASVTTPTTGGGAISYAVKTGSENYIDVNASTGALTIKAVPPTDGKAYVIVTAAETDDYAETTKEVTVTISPATPVITLADSNFTYNGDPKQIIQSVTYPGGTDLYLRVDCLTSYKNKIYWAKYTGSSDLTNVFAPTNAGTYSVYYFVGTPDNPEGGTRVDGQTRIDKALPKSDNFTFTAPSSLNYDGTAKTATVTIKDGVIGMGEVTVRYYSDEDRYNEVAECKNPGTYYVGIDVDNGENYNSDERVYDWYDDSWKFTIASPHTHSFTYTADGATVTATCGAEGCDLTSNPTLTIVAPTLTTYGQTGEGISEKATLDGLDAFNSATDLTVAASDIKYYGVEEYEIEGHTYKKQGDELAQVPTAAGEYVAGLTLSNVKTSETETGDVIARVWYTIAPASISSVTVTDITAPVATEALDTEAATSTANVTLGAVTWNPTTTPAAYATQYTATVIATAAANYAFADTVTATVNGQAATVTKNDGGTLTIAYTFEKTALTPVTITATDKKADWSADGIAIPVEGMFTITEGAGAATYTVTNGTGEGTYDAQTGKLTVTKCGTFTVKVSTAATDTYAAGAETTATLTVNKVDSTAATVTANTLTYTGSAQALVTVTGEATGGTMQYALGTKDAATEEYTTSIPTATNAGTYYVYYKVIGDDNHEDSQPVCITVMIAPAYAVITKDPSDAKVIRGSRVTFRIAATGENVTYRWETSKDNGETWVKSNADGADTDKIVFKATESLDGRLYRCVAITDAGKVFSASAQLTTLPVISSQPRNAAATIGSVASFTVKARSSVAKYQWQISLDGGATWKKSGSEGAETATVNITVNGAKYNGYLFRCKVTNGTWTEYSKEVKLSVKTAIVKQPEDVSEYYGNLVKLYVKATGVNPQYQWQVKNASGKWVNSTSAGNNTNILAFTSRASLDGRQFRCKITDENGTVYSNIITFTAVEK